MLPNQQPRSRCCSAHLRCRRLRRHHRPAPLRRLRARALLQRRVQQGALAHAPRRLQALACRGGGGGERRGGRVNGCGCLLISCSKPVAHSRHRPPGALSSSPYSLPCVGVSPAVVLPPLPCFLTSPAPSLCMGACLWMPTLAPGPPDLDSRPLVRHLGQARHQSCVHVNTPITLRSAIRRRGG